MSQAPSNAQTPSVEVQCPVCDGRGINYSRVYFYGQATCLLCDGHGRVIDRGDGTYRKVTS